MTTRRKNRRADLPRQCFPAERGGGRVDNPAGLAQIWQVEAGSSRGASQTFYGYEWTGQPAIVKWSTQVRAASNIDEDKKVKSALREVIIAGVDGVIRFIDLEDGVLTRGAINMGYPMRGTPACIRRDTPT